VVVELGAAPVDVGGLVEEAVLGGGEVVGVVGPEPAAGGSNRRGDTTTWLVDGSSAVVVRGRSGVVSRLRGGRLLRDVVVVVSSADADATASSTLSAGAGESSGAPHSNRCPSA